MEDTDFIIKDSPKIQTVERLDTLFTPSFRPALNACAYHRRLTLDFNALARHVADRMEADRYVRHMDYDGLAALRAELGEGAERDALDFIIKDADALLDLHRPGFARLSCRFIRANPVDQKHRSGAELFHEDGEEGDPYFENVLCNYAGRPTEYIASHDAMPYKAALRYYVATEETKIKNFGLGNIWRFASRNSEATGQGLIHRAPRVLAAEAPRMLLMLVRSNRALWPAFEA